MTLGIKGVLLAELKVRSLRLVVVGVTLGAGGVASGING